MFRRTFTNSIYKTPSGPSTYSRTNYNNNNTSAYTYNNNNSNYPNNSNNSSNLKYERGNLKVN